MPDHLTRRQPEDRTRINLGQSWELKYWCAEFGCTESTLRVAVDCAGVSAEAVRKWLGR